MIHTTLTSEVILSGNSPWFGNGISLYDFNHDGLDDLTCADAYHPTKIFMNTPGGLEWWMDVPNDEDIKSVHWIDYDNDGDADLFTSAYFGHCKLYRNDGEQVLTDVSGALNLPPGDSYYF